MNVQRILRSSILVVFMVGLALILPWLLTGHGPTARAATLCVDAAGGVATPPFKPPLMQRFLVIASTSPPGLTLSR